MNFLQISQLPKEERDDILAGLKRSERSAYNDYELRAANQGKQEAEQTGKAIDLRIQAANQAYVPRAYQYMEEVNAGRRVAKEQLLRDILDNPEIQSHHHDLIDWAKKQQGRAGFTPPPSRR